MALTVKTVHLTIGGMTCINCQNRIENKLKNVPGIVDVQVSYRKGTGTVRYDTEKISYEKIVKEINKLDYQVLPDKGQMQPSIDYIVAILAVIILLFYILQRFGILNLLVPSQLADTGMGYGMLFVTGLLTSVHCIAMCGGINLSQCVSGISKQKVETVGGRQEQKEVNESNIWSTYGPTFLYNLGRVISYTVIGFVFGLIGMLVGGGSGVGISAVVQGILKLAAGIIMVIMGINMLGIFPWLRKINPGMPRFLADKINQRKRQGGGPLLVGILNGFMPCGPLQSMWIVALASGSPLKGALSMFLFSLGTVPLMLGLGSVVSALGRQFSQKVMTAGSVLVVVLGLALISQGGILSGLLQPKLLTLLVALFFISGVLVSLPYKKKTMQYAVGGAAVILTIGTCIVWYSLNGNVGENLAEIPAISNEIHEDTQEDIQVVHSNLERGTYPNITVQVGVPVKWIIDAPESSINGCNYKMQIPDYDIEYAFEPGENVIEFTPEHTGDIAYSCWMGMIYGNITVVE